jgi:hypothetical protein
MNKLAAWYSLFLYVYLIGNLQFQGDIGLKKVFFLIRSIKNLRYWNVEGQFLTVSLGNQIIVSYSS